MVRRVITANNAAGKSYFAADEAVDDRELWQSVVDNPLGRSPDARPTNLRPSTAPQIEPPPGGSKCAFIEMEPWKVFKTWFEGEGIPGHDSEGFHRTMTVDYIMMTEGEVTLLLDEGQTTIRAGDLVVQRNTRHSWQVRSDRPAKFWAVAVSLKVS